MLERCDKIVKNCGELQWELRIMTKEEVATKFEDTVKEVEDWIIECGG